MDRESTASTPPCDPVSPGSTRDLSPPASPTPRADSPTEAGRLGPPVGTAAAPPLLEPVSADDRYEILGELGRGGIGVVHLARQRGLDRCVALKMLKIGAEASPEQIQRFAQEAHAAARLHHPGIVSVYDVGEMRGARFIAMEYVHGARMDRWVEKAGADLRTRVDLIRRTAEAVAHAHQEGIVHRDLKPANVLVDGDGAPHVADFGLAKEIDAEAAGLTQTSAVMGTPHYMSPEQVRATRDVDMRTDVWALGVMLYEALTGKKPFDGAATYAIVVKILTAEPIPPRRLNPTVHADLETICLKALEKEPSRRYGLAGEFAADLGRFLAGEAILARPMGRAERAWRWSARRKALVGALAGITLLVGGLWLTRRSEAAERARAAEAVAARKRVLQTMHDKVRASVMRFEDTIKNVPMWQEARCAFADQSLEMLEALIAEDPEFGPLYSWRGEVQHFLRDYQKAEADFDRGCALTHQYAIVWYLRGRYWIERYTDARGMMVEVNNSSEVTIELRRERPDEETLRKKGLADLDRMSEAAQQDALFGAEEARLGRAEAVLIQDGANRWKEALELLAGVDRPLAAKMRGQAYYLGKDFDRAVAEFSRTLAVWRIDSVTFNSRGSAWCARGIAEARRRIDPRASYGKAIADYTEALKYQPESADIFNGRGIAYQDLGRAERMRRIDPRASFAKAIADFDAALRIDANSARTCCNRGATHADLAEVEAEQGVDPHQNNAKAIADFSEALRLDPELAGACYGRGNAYLSRGRAEAARGIDSREILRKALPDYAEALRRNPDFAAAYTSRGITYCVLGEAESAWGADPRESYRKAGADFAEALRRSPTSAAAHDDCGKAHLLMSDAEADRGIDPRDHLGKAIEENTEALRLDPENVTSYMHRALDYMRLGQFEADHGIDPRENYRKAIADFAEALRRGPMDEAVANRGACYKYLADAEAARGIDPREIQALAEADLRAGVQRRNPASMFNLGLLYRAMARFDEAVAAFEDSAKAAPSNAARVRAQVAKTRWIQQAAKLAGEPWAADLAAADRASQSGDRAAARAAYEKGLARIDQGTAEERGQRERDPVARAMLMRAHYNLACLLSLDSAAPTGADAAGPRAGLRDAAFEHLGRALDCGWSDRAHLEGDPDLVSLRDDPRWSVLNQRLPEAPKDK